MNAFRITLTLTTRKPRLDQVLLEALRLQTRNLQLKNISRSAFKALFNAKKIQIKGQNATPSSHLAAGTTDIDILGFSDDT